MSGYRSNHTSSEDELTVGIMKLVLTVAVVVAAVGATIVCYLLTAGVTVYRKRAFAPTATRCILWTALGLFSGLLGLAILLAVHAATARLGLYLAAGSTVCYGGVVAGCECYERRHDHPHIASSLDQVLLPWPAAHPAGGPGPTTSVTPQGGNHGSATPPP